MENVKTETIGGKIYAVIKDTTNKEYKLRRFKKKAKRCLGYITVTERDYDLGDGFCGGGGGLYIAFQAIIPIENAYKYM